MRMHLIRLILSVILCFPGIATAADEFTIYAGNLPPYHSYDEEGHAIGLSVDVLAEMLRRSEIPFHNQRTCKVPWARAVEETRFKTHRLIIGAMRTPERESHFKWVGPYATLNVGLIAKKDRGICIATLRDLSRYSIGVITNSAPAEQLVTLAPDTRDTMELLTTSEQQFRMLAADRVDMISHVGSVALYFMRSLNMNPKAYEIVYLLDMQQLYFALSKDTDDAVVERMQKSLNSMRSSADGGDGTLDAILAGHDDAAPLQIHPNTCP